MKLVAMSLVAMMMTSAALAQNANTTTTTIGTVQPKAASKFSGAYTLQATKDIETLKTTGGNSLVHQLDLIYKMDNGLKASLVGVMDTPIAGEGQKQSDMRGDYKDLALKIGGKGGSLAGSEPSSVSARIYLPTSALSAKKDRQFALRADADLNWKADGPISAIAGVSPRYYQYKEEDNLFLGLAYAGANYDISDKVSSYAIINHSVEIAGRANMKRTGETLGPEVGVNLAPQENLMFTFSVGQDRNVLNPGTPDRAGNVARKNLALFDTKETAYNIIGVVTF